MNTQQRSKAIRQYVVYHLKMIELLHLMLISFHLSESRVAPANELGHDVDRFRETLLGMIATTFASLIDHSDSTNVLDIWTALFPKRKKVIERIWDRQIKVGAAAMKAYRDQAGAHGDKPGKYFEGKLLLSTRQDVLLDAMGALLRLSAALYRVRYLDIPDFDSQIEGVILDIELTWPRARNFDRQWLKAMHLIPKGNFSKRF